MQPKYPQLKKRINKFLHSEEGKITREQAILGVTTLMIMAATVSTAKGKTSGGSRKPLVGGMKNRTGLHGSHGSHGSHCSHASHSSHGSHGSHGSHASHGSHGSHASHGSHGSHASHGSHGSHCSHGSHGSHGSW